MPESVNCNLCHSAELSSQPRLARLLNLSPHYDVVKCNNCSLIFLSPRPTKEEYELFYSQDETYSVNAYLDRVKTRITFYKKRLAQIETILGNRGRLLEIGCAAGHFLNIAKANGWEVCGIEISAPLSEYARSHFGLDVRTAGTLPEASLADECFDVVYSRHVLEHLLDPMTTLMDSLRIIKNGGVLFLEVPNQFEDIKALIKALILPLIKSQIKMPLSSIHHTFFFSPRTLKKMVEKAGFTVEKITTGDENYQFLRDASPLGGYWLNDMLGKTGSWLGRGPIILVTARKS